ncbi:MAG TPA: polysaccharide deacetylase family protein [Candidatus Aquilonibacter sp.]|jgi:peptidoglycan/xylan/chitin deacetylase (PgdA/CDA1 family)|nr:polysaccharide deacetylase family protein [Candidatus Aquilonibacter sp.]
MTALAAASIGLAGSAAYFSPWFWRRYRMAGVRREVTKKRMLVLTYDDGPSGLTPQLLDLLEQRGARATFFMLGRHAQQHSGIVDRLAEQGHDIGCHTAEHLNAWKVLPGAAVADIDAGYQQLSPWIQADGMFRPPYGKMTLPTSWSLRRRKAPVWWWTIDSGDTDDVLPRPAQVADRLRKAGGGIVLMHDLDRTQERNNFVLETTASLLDVAGQESLQVASLREICR